MSYYCSTETNYLSTPNYTEARNQHNFSTLNLSRLNHSKKDIPLIIATTSTKSSSKNLSRNNYHSGSKNNMSFYNITEVNTNKYNEYKTSKNKLSSKSIKDKLSDKILNSEFIPFKHKKYKSKKIFNVDVFKTKSFLFDKIKTKPIKLTNFDCIYGNKGKRLIYEYLKKNNLFKTKSKIKFYRPPMINNNNLNISYKYIISKNKKAINAAHKFKKKLAEEGKDNIKEHNKFIESLRMNLNLSRSKIKKKFNYN